MSNEKRYWLLGGGARNEVRQSTFASNSVKQSPRFALAAPQAQLQFSTNVSKASLRNVGRRANELLNFTFAKRERVGENGAAAESNARTRRAVSKRTVSSYSKEQYLLANCQFAVRFYCHPKDAAVDAPIDWQAVEFVRISACSDELPHCPICLDTPLTSARITRCGHVYCYVCLLRYLTVSSESDRDGDKANCPICAEVIRERDLRIAQLRLVPTYRVGDRLRFALVRRSGESAMRLQRVASVRERVDVELQAAGSGEVKEDDGDCELFSKLIHVSTKQLEAVVTDEYNLIVSERQMAADSLKSAVGVSQTTSAECEDLENQIIFLDLALGRVNERLAALNRELENEAKNTLPTPPASLFSGTAQLPKTLTTEHQHDVARKRYVDAFDELPAARKLESQSEAVLESSEPPSDAPATAVGPSASPGPVTVSGVSCVYQAEDGQSIFLHPLNVRCLLAQFGDVPASNEVMVETGTTLDERFPPFIEGAVVQLDSFEMTIELRKRYKHLAHLPILSHFTIAELDLSSEPNLLDERVVRLFGAQTEKRRLARERRAQEDRMRAQEAEQLAIERERERRAVFDSSNFPSLRTEEEELGEVDESQLHNEDTFPQIGVRKSSEGDSQLSVTGASPTSPMPASNAIPNPCSVQSASNSVWFRTAEPKRTSDSHSAMANERQTFSALVKSIREDETKRQQNTCANTASKTIKAKKPELPQAAVWAKLKASPHQTCGNDADRARMRSDVIEDADYELDGASSLSHYKDAFQQDVDAALLRAFSTMSTSAATNATNAKPEQLVLDVPVASLTNDAGHTQKHDEPADIDDTDRERDRQNTKRKKKAEKKPKGTLLFSTNMRRPL